jgi:hypothetical protein
MGTTYKSTIEVSCWKEHTCGGCGAVFRYLFKRTKTGQAGSERAASDAARAAVVKALTREVDMQPCPTCGLYQADMIGARRSFSHWVLFWIALPCLVVIIFLGGIQVIPYGIAAWLAAAVSLGVLICQIVFAGSNPNRSPGANLQRAEGNFSAGTLQQINPGDPTQMEHDVRWHRLSVVHWICFALLGVGILALASPELVRTVNGWPLNPAWYPQVAGPGDDPYVYFGQKISCVKGYWRGTGKAEVTNAAQLGLPPPPLRVESQNSNWGASISVKSSEKSTTATPWARVHLPSGADWSGKNLTIKIDLSVAFPKIQGANDFKADTAQYSQSVSIQLATPKAGSTYRSFFWLGSLAGATIIVVMSAVLALTANGLRRRALPTQVYPLQEDRGDED